ncbi:MAG: hypothetical protein ABL996_22105 [Micropepsaceae bacterium]
MTVQVADSDKSFNAIKPALFWGAGIVAILALLYAVFAQLERVVARWPSVTQVSVSPSHCDEFIALAKAKYGAEWKYRLDPRDNTCGPQVQQAWERHWTPRDLPPPQPLLTASDLAPPIIAMPAQRRSNTYCLNVISLAKAKHGADWATKMDSAERAACAGDVGAAGR